MPPTDSSGRIVAAPARLDHVKDMPRDPWPGSPEAAGSPPLLAFPYPSVFVLAASAGLAPPRSGRPCWPFHRAGRSVIRLDAGVCRGPLPRRIRGLPPVGCCWLLVAGRNTAARSRQGPQQPCSFRCSRGSGPGRLRGRPRAARPSRPGAGRDGEAIDPQGLQGRTNPLYVAKAACAQTRPRHIPAGRWMLLLS